jgi:integrase
MHPFKKAELVNCGGDLSKRWYIKFYVWNVQKGKLVRKRDYSVNEYQTADQRMAYAKQRIQSINTLLTEGYHIDSGKASEEVIQLPQILTLEAALKLVLDLKKQAFRRSSYLSFSSTLNNFLEWARACRIQELPLQSFDRYNALAYIDSLIIAEKHGGKTINSKVSYLKSLFNELKERGLISENPFVKIKKQKETKSLQNLAYTEKDIEVLRIAIETQDPELWSFVQFIYYCYLRPNEIRMLRYENLNLATGKIFIPATISKNGKESYVDMPEPFIKYLMSKGFKGSGQAYIFTTRNTDRPLSKNKMSERHKRIIDKQGFDSRHTLYSWKHTGVVMAYKAGVDIKSIQRQCRHSSIDMTDNYLKSLGLYDNEAFLMKMPGL